MNRNLCDSLLTTRFMRGYVEKIVDEKLRKKLMKKWKEYASKKGFYFEEKLFVSLLESGQFIKSFDYIFPYCSSTVVDSNANDIDEDQKDHKQSLLALLLRLEMQMQEEKKDFKRFPEIVERIGKLNKKYDHGGVILNRKKYSTKDVINYLKVVSIENESDKKPLDLERIYELMNIEVKETMLKKRKIEKVPHKIKNEPPAKIRKTKEKKSPKKPNTQDPKHAPQQEGKVISHSKDLISQSLVRSRKQKRIKPFKEKQEAITLIDLTSSSESEEDNPKKLLGKVKTTSIMKKKTHKQKIAKKKKEKKKKVKKPVRIA